MWSPEGATTSDSDFGDSAQARELDVRTDIGDLFLRPSSFGVSRGRSRLPCTHEIPSSFVVIFHYEEGKVEVDLEMAKLQTSNSTNFLSIRGLIKPRLERAIASEFKIK